MYGIVIVVTVEELGLLSSGTPVYVLHFMKSVIWLFF